ncbi:RNA-binding protein 25-like [Solenopsis invicta]|uniref:RNA-binding protein 25-like n=1 Tax=Solenopsis invicta TaxID=13686 RepID=UPI00193E99EE|nr:RNA-binding protein 25-like [Solenopsis invicta]XP_039307244.1 RNA-binding protein 25-like [Solenopsis invicta]XP_039307245.1 RNA-binding protein 25-like [Solenopsis invicta]
MRERSNSAPLLELLKRGEKRKGEQGEETRVEEGEIFKRSNMVKRSPVRQEEGGLKEILREVREGFKEMKSELRELRDSREEMREWMEEMRKRVDNLERRVEGIEKGRGRAEKVTGGREKDKGEEIEQMQIRGKSETKELEERMRRLELERERGEREKRKRNIIIKGVRVKEEGKEELKREIEKIVEATGVVARVEGVRRIGNKDKDKDKVGGIMVWVRLASVREKIDVMKGKMKLRDRKEWIVDDSTEKERRVEWWIKREAERNRRKGKKVRVGYMKMWIEDKLWIWDEIKDQLREWRGRDVRVEERGGKEEKGKEVF